MGATEAESAAPYIAQRAGSQDRIAPDESTLTLLTRLSGLRSMPIGFLMAARTATKAHPMTVKLTLEQTRAIAQRAERCGMRPGTWARAILVQAANRPSTDGFLRIKEPDGTLI